MNDEGADEVPLEGWSVVRHRVRDDIGSDADSVEVISDDSDRDTCDEGKDDGDLAVDEQNREDSPRDTAEPVTTTEEPDLEVDGIGDGGSTDVNEDTRSHLVDLDSLGELTRTLSNKLHHLLAGNAGTLSREELMLRYIVIASALLALTCSLLVSSFLLFSRVNRYENDSGNDPSAVQAVTELEEAIFKLKNVLRLENEQHLREVLSNMPADYLTLERLIPMADHLPSQIPDHGFHTAQINSETNVQTTSKIRLDPSHPHESEYLSVEATDHVQPLKEDFTKSKTSHTLNTPLKEDFKKSKTSHTLPTPPKTSTAHEPLQNDPTLNIDQSPKTKNRLLDIRKKLISIQKDIYSQIMNSVLEYKIDLYKNLLRASLDISCPEFSKKANHKNFMLIRTFQQIIAKSSESNFESWYKFYSFSVFPKIRAMLGEIDELAKSSTVAYDDPTPQVNETKRSSQLNDDFFIRAGEPLEDRVETTRDPPQSGFDWKNLDKKIRESMRDALNRGRPKHSYSDRLIREEKHLGDDGLQVNYVEISQGLEHRKDKLKNNLKGDFRKRKGSKHEHVYDQNRNFARPQSQPILEKSGNQIELEGHQQQEYRTDEQDYENRNMHEQEQLIKHMKSSQSQTNENGRDVKEGTEHHKHIVINEKHDEYQHNTLETSDVHKKYDSQERLTEDDEQENLGRHDKPEKHHGLDNLERYDDDEKSNEQGGSVKREKRGRHGSQHRHDKHGKQGKHNSQKKQDEDNKLKKHKRQDSHEKYNSRAKQTKQDRYDSNDEHEKHKRQASREMHEKHSWGKHDKLGKPKESKHNAKDEQQEHMFDAGGNTYDDTKKHEHENSGKHDDAFKHSSDDYWGPYHREKMVKRKWKKISYGDVGRYMKKTMAGLWNNVMKGYAIVKDYSKGYTKDWHSKSKYEAYAEWRKEFVKEMNDVIRVMGVNPTLVSLSKVPKSVSNLLVGGLSSFLGVFEENNQMGPGPEGLKVDERDKECEDASKSKGDEGYDSDGYSESGRDGPSWYDSAANHRSEARATSEYPRVSDSSWFLGLGRHRAYLRRRGIHLDDDGSWFISSAKHRAKMRQKHFQTPDPSIFHSQASSKR